MATTAASAPSADRSFINTRAHTRFFGAMGMAIDLVASAAETGDTLEAIDCVFPAGSGMPLHFHEGTDEFIFVVEGELSIQTADGATTAPAGAIASFPRGTSHSIANASHLPTRTLILWSPRLASGAEEVLTTLASLPAGQQDMTTLLPLLASCDMHLTRS